MKKNIVCARGFFIIILLFIAVQATRAQYVNPSAGWGEYIPSQFTGYDNGATGPWNPVSEGLFYATVYKTSGTIPANTARIIIVLAPQAPWTGAIFTIPSGWTLLPESTPTNLTFDNTSDWSGSGDDDFVIQIPVRAIATRTTTAQSVGTQVFNIGGDWDENQTDNVTTSAVTVADVPLPVTLTTFTATIEGTTANLKWTTTEETNASHFEIQRSADARNWNPIGNKEAAGESKSTINYSFTDSTPLSGTNYYRLKMIDNDATFAYSRIESVKFHGGLVSIYPNPVNDVLFLTGIESNNVEQISIHNNLGQTVYAASSVSPSGIDVSKLAVGIYLVRITETGGTIHTNKVVIIR